MRRGLAHVGVGHDPDVVQKDHRDVGGRVRDAGEAGFGLEAVELLPRHVHRDVGRATLDLGDAGRGVGGELEDHRVEGGCAAPVVLVGLEAQERPALELLDHVRARTHRRLLEAFLADLLVMVRRDQVAAQERQALQHVGAPRGHVEAHAVAGDLDVLDTGEDRLQRGRQRAQAVQVPGDVRGRDRAAVVPGGTLAGTHRNCALVAAPGELVAHAGGKRQVLALHDVRVEDRPVDARQAGADRGGAGVGVPARRRHVVGDREGVAYLGGGFLRPQEGLEPGAAQGGGRGRGT